jgi:hypothetical protein
MDALVTVEMLAAKFGTILPHLDERQRRLLLGAEARALGHGGIRLVARAAGVREATVAAGVDELDAGTGPLGRVRRAGGGRKRAAEADPGLVPALLALVEPGERGDPQSPLRWTVKSTRTLAAELTAQGHRAGADTVGDLLREQGFSLQGNARALGGGQHPDRDGQFRYISEQAKAHQHTGDPVISVDTKKKEPVGDYRNAGRTWRPAGHPVPVNDHDFAGPQLGKAIPYGIYDLAANTGWVNVGTDHDTAAFAVESIRRWWNGAGRGRYPAAQRLLITADAGGSNGYRTRAWKTELAAFAHEAGLQVTVCHFPPGTSKWNKIEHRLFSAITHNWRGRPLTSHQVIVNSIAATTTSTGLRVHAELDPASYPAKIKISGTQIDGLPMDRHDWHGDWNYTFRPQPATPQPAVPSPPRPGLAWLCHPAITGMPGPAFDALTAALTGPAAQHHQAWLNRRRGDRPRQRAGNGRRSLTLTTKILAVILRDRHHLPQAAIAALCQIHPDTLSMNIAPIRRLIPETGHTIHPASHKLTTLDDLYRHAAIAGITIPATNTAR